MKKFISMVMAAAMVISMVPATAFAADHCAGTVAGDVSVATSPVAYNGNAELQLVIPNTFVGKTADATESFDVTLYFDGATLDGTATASPSTIANVWRTQDDAAAVSVADIRVTAQAASADFMKLNIKEDGTHNMKAGDTIIIPMKDLKLNLDSVAAGHEATVYMGGDFESDEYTFLSIDKKYLDINVAGKNKEVAEGDVVTLNEITIKSKPTSTFTAPTTVSLRVKGGFEIYGTVTATGVTSGTGFTASRVDDDEVAFVITGGTDSAVTITGMQIEAVDASAGDIAVLEVKADGYKAATDEAAVVIGGGVVMEIADEDVPVMYSGTDVNETGLTSKNDHESLEVTIKETSVDAWNTNKAWTLSLPEGVYVQDVTVNDSAHVTAKKTADNSASVAEMFKLAYQEGAFEEFAFPTKALEVDNNEKAEITFTLTLVADPDFEGDVTLTLDGDDFETAYEGVIATFVKPVVVEAAPVDAIIDYKETELATEVTLTEAEAGLWKTGTTFELAMEEIAIEDVTIAVDEASEMEIRTKGNGFVVVEKSDEEAAVVTADAMKLYMQRNLPAGGYNLKLGASFIDAYLGTQLFGQTGTDKVTDVTGWESGYTGMNTYCGTVVEDFVNIITAGRDQDDATFTTEVIVTVGNTEFFVGGEAYTMDVPAYINADNRTMMPIRAVATALGINDDCVRWDGATKTITILYGQRTITMKAGDRMVYINAAVMPATTAVEIVNGRAFLPLRDLAAALGVTDVAWDNATQTATLNGSY